MDESAAHPSPEPVPASPPPRPDRSAPTPDGEPARPRRVRIVGVSGAGKTTLAAEAARRLGVAHLELDAVFWDRDWTFRDVEEARALVREFVAAHPDGWVADGNWRTRLEGLLEPGTPGGADLVVWLDHSRALVMSRLVRRTVRRGVLREELWHGNRENPADWIRRDPEENILLWGWTQHGPTRTRFAPRVGDPTFLRLGGRRAVAAWLDSLGPARADTLG